MSCNLFARIRYFTSINVRSFASLETPNTTPRTNFTPNWRELEALSYGGTKMNHGRKLEKAFKNIQRVLEVNGNQLCPIGSWPMGSFTPSSDLDLILIPNILDEKDKPRSVFEKKVKNEFYRSAAKLDKSGIFSEKVQVIPHSIVPILKGKVKGNVSVDVQIGGTNPLYSTNYVKLAFTLDPRLILLYNWLRSEMATYNIFGGRDGRFTSFHLYMLLLHFAQATHILPLLIEQYPHLVSAPWPTVREYIIKGQDTPPLYSRTDPQSWAPILVNQLIDYFSNIDFTQNEINVGRGELKQRATNSLCLIEPFHDQQNGVCRTSNGAAIMNKLFEKLKKKYGR